MNHQRIRGVLAARAHVDVGQVLAELNSSFGSFKNKYDAELAELTKLAEGTRAAVDELKVGGGAGDRGIHPAAGIRGSGRRFTPIGGEVADEFRNQLLGRPTAGMTTQSNPDGGYTVAPEVDGVIDQVLRDLSPLRSLARVVQLPAGKGHWEKIIGRSGAQSAWAGEEDQRGDTDTPTLGKVEIHPAELYAIPQLTNHVIEDSSFDLNAFLEEDVSGEFALTESQAFIDGDGIKKPRGFLSYPTATTVDSSRAFGTLQYVASGDSDSFPDENPADVLINVVAALRPVYRKGDGVAWLMNSTTAGVVRKFKDGDGRYLWVDSIAAGQPDRLLGYPVALDEGMPDIGADKFAIAFGNWKRGYAIVDKPDQLRLIVDRLTRKGWTKLYFSRRVGGGVVDSNAIKLLKFASS